MRTEVKDDCASGTEAIARSRKAHAWRREMLKVRAPEPQAARLEMTADVHELPAPLVSVSRPSTSAPLPAPPQQRPVAPLDPPNRYLISVRHVIRATSERFGVAEMDLISDRREAIIVRPRQIAMYVAQRVTGKSYPHIGRQFGGRDHTTVLHAFRRVTAIIEGGDTRMLADVDAIEQRADALVEAGVILESQFRRAPLPTPRTGEIDPILMAVTDHFRIDIRGLRSRTNLAAVHWRCITSYVAKIAGLSTMQISRGLDRSHAAVFDGVSRAQRLINSGDERTIRDIEAIREKLKARIP